MNLLGIDLGSSSIKLAVIESDSGLVIAKSQYPESEMKISSPNPGWAEQSPAEWLHNLKNAISILSKKVKLKTIAAIGISYQMHGLVCIDKSRNVIRPAIIWCDSRAVQTGEKAFEALGKEKCLTDLLNSPGNFTASKLAWLKKNEITNYEKIYKIMLPGDFIAMYLSGEILTTLSGLSEGIFWNYSTNSTADFLLKYYGIAKDLLPDITETFGEQGKVCSFAAEEIGLPVGIPIAYRAGDQPNNAFSLNVLNPGEIAATAGTSGVVYAVSDKKKYDPLSRVNIFAHTNYSSENPRFGILLCINGAGILYSWMKKNFFNHNVSYHEMNEEAAKAQIGSKGILMFPFGNGAERFLENKNIKAHIQNLDFNTHNRSDILRAGLEGIAFSFMRGIKIMEKYNGVEMKTVRAGYANLFLSPVFRETLASILQEAIEIYDTDGATGAARGAGIGIGVYKNESDAFKTLKKVLTVEPVSPKTQILEAYDKWNSALKKFEK